MNLSRISYIIRWPSKRFVSSFNHSTGDKQILECKFLKNLVAARGAHFQVTRNAVALKDSFLNTKNKTDWRRLLHLNGGRSFALDKNQVGSWSAPLDSEAKAFAMEGNKEMKEEKEWRKIKLGLIILGSTLLFASGSVIYILGKQQVDEEGNLIVDSFSELPMFEQFLKRFISQLEYYTKVIKKPSNEKLLPDPLKYPYIQPKYTLVLEMTDLLVHPEWTYQTGWRFKKRPGVDDFLKQVRHPNFEVVIYTAEQGLTAFPILDALDPNHYIMFRLVRDATDFIDGDHVKNLDYLNRDLSKVIVVDWNKSSVKLHRHNSVLIPRWEGNDDDTTLYDLAAFLNTIAVNDVDDVREVMMYYAQFDNPLLMFRENQRKLLEQLEEKEKIEKQRKQNPTIVSRWSGKVFNTQR